MKDEALALAETQSNPTAKLNLLREYLQAFVLRLLHEKEAFTSLAFVGGTALRFLENLPRFSEDLDFSRTEAHGYEPEKWLAAIKQELVVAGYDARVTWKASRPVHVAWIRIADLLFPAGLSDRADHNLSIKLEIDTNPPQGAEIRASVVTRHLTFVVRHYTLETLMAGKIRALLTRPYNKGRDWFDLLWFSSKRPRVFPNLDFLQNALDQSQEISAMNAADWPRMLRERLSTIRVENLVSDTAAFLERTEDRLMLKEQHLRSALADFEEGRRR